MAQEPNDIQSSVTPSSAAEPELEEIRGQMEDTRAALSDKIETLQEKVSETVEAAQTTVEHTVETVQRTFDLKYQVRQRPWIMLGASLVGGYLLGCLVLRGGRRAQAMRAEPNGDRADGRLRDLSAQPLASQPESKPKSRLLGKFEAELDGLTNTAIEAGMQVMRDWVHTAIAGLSPQQHPSTTEERHEPDWAVPRRMGNLPGAER